jgi:hypothetical protein
MGFTPIEEKDMNTVVTYKNRNTLKVKETVLATIQALSQKMDFCDKPVFNENDVVRAIRAQGYEAINLHDVTTALSRLMHKGHSIAFIHNGWWSYDSSLRVGRVTAILAVAIECRECGGVCDLPSGASMIMIEEQDVILTCEDCGLQCRVPSDAFTMRS